MDRSISAQRLSVNIPTRLTTIKPSSTDCHPQYAPDVPTPSPPLDDSGSENLKQDKHPQPEGELVASPTVTETVAVVTTTALKTEAADLVADPYTVTADSESVPVPTPLSIAADTEAPPVVALPAQTPAVTTRRRTSILKQPLEAALHLEEPVKTTEKAVKFNSTDFTPKNRANR